MKALAHMADLVDQGDRKLSDVDLPGTVPIGSSGLCDAGS